MTKILDRKKEYIKRFSDAYGWLAECDDSGNIIVSTNEQTNPTWIELPYISAPKMQPNEETAELRDGSNAVIYNDSQLASYEFTTEILQADKKSQDLGEYARGKFFALIYKVGDIGEPAKTQYHIYCPGQISSTSQIDLSDFLKVGFTFKTVRNDQAIELTSLPEELSDKLTALNETAIIPAGKQRLILEV